GVFVTARGDVAAIDAAAVVAHAEVEIHAEARGLFAGEGQRARERVGAAEHDLGVGHPLLGGGERGRADGEGRQQQTNDPGPHSESPLYRRRENGSSRGWPGRGGMWLRSYHRFVLPSVLADLFLAICRHDAIRRQTVAMPPGMNSMQPMRTLPKMSGR